MIVVDTVMIMVMTVRVDQIVVLTMVHTLVIVISALRIVVCL